MRYLKYLKQLNLAGLFKEAKAMALVLVEFGRDY